MPRCVFIFISVLIAMLLKAGATGTNADFAFEVKDEAGRPLKLLSLEAYHAEFNYLRSVFHQIDLKGPAVQTDGWNYNISEAEWPFMGFSYFGYASADLAQLDPALRTNALAD